MERTVVVMGMKISIKRIYEWGSENTERIARIVSEFYSRFYSDKGDVPTAKQVIENQERYYLLTVTKDSVDDDDIVVQDREVLVAVGAILMSRGELMRIAIHPKYRGRGLLKLLILHMVKVYYTETDNGRLQIWVRKEDRGLIGTLQRIGFRKAREEHNRVKYVLRIP